MSDAARARRARDLRIVAALEAGMSCRKVGELFGLSGARVCQVRKAALARVSLTREKSLRPSPQRDRPRPGRKA